MDILKKLIKKLKFNLIYDEKIRKNNCEISGKNIFIGNYQDKELEIISIFHEIGHTLIKAEFKKKWHYNTLIIELEAWNKGIEKAREVGYIFTDKAIEWAYKENALSYVGHDEREIRKESWEIRKKLLWKEKQKLERNPNE